MTKAADELKHSSGKDPPGKSFQNQVRLNLQHHIFKTYPCSIIKLIFFTCWGEGNEEINMVQNFI